MMIIGKLVLKKSVGKPGNVPGSDVVKTDSRRACVTLCGKTGSVVVY